MVRMERLELSRLAAPEPKSGVYTNFTTSAKDGDYTGCRSMCVTHCARIYRQYRESELGENVTGKMGQLCCHEVVSHRDVANQPLGESPYTYFEAISETRFRK